MKVKNKPCTNKYLNYNSIENLRRRGHVRVQEHTDTKLRENSFCTRFRHRVYRLSW